jgi:hypothetical protein
MECRWVVGIALWTFLSGPVFVGLSVPTPARQVKRATQTSKPIEPPVSDSKSAE